MILGTKTTTKIATWNVRTLFQAGKTNIVANEMSKYNIDILGLTEVRWDNQGELKLQGGQQLLYSGHVTQQPIHTHGVGLLLSKQAQKALISWEAHGPRLTEALFRTQHKKIKLRIIVCYAPTNDASEEEKEDFYGQMDQILATAHRQSNIEIVMGDLNAKIGNQNNGLERAMGTEGLGNINENGEKFAHFCLDHDLVIGGSLFPHKDIHKETWISPDGRTKNQIDHISISNRFRRSLLDVRSFRGADINSDHHLVIGKLRLKLKKMANKTPARTKYNLNALKNEEVRNSFQIDVQNRFAALDSLEDESVEEKWEHFKATIKDAGRDTLGFQRQTISPWITEVTLELIQNRRNVKNSILNTEGARQAEAREEYRILSRNIKRSLRSDKRRFIEKQAQEAENAAQTGNMSKVYKITKTLSGKKTGVTSPHIKNSEGILLTNPVNIEERWVQHFKTILNRPPPVRTADIPPAQTRLNINCNSPTLQEIKNAIKSLKNDKAAGPDGIPAELLKVNPDTTAEMLLPIFKKIWEEETFPEDLKNGHLSVLPKKGDLKDCNNYRGIMLMSAPGKILTKILLERMKNTVDAILRKNQAGFRSNRSCTDQIATLRIIIEQSTELNSPLYVHFLDYSKAFDSIDRESLWKIMAHYGIPDKIISLVKSMYEGSGGCIIHKGKLTTFFEITTGVRQGCLLSPFLFLLCIDWILRQSTENEQNGIQWTIESKLDDLDFADDVALLSHTLKQMQDKTDNIKENSAKLGLTINTAKTKFLRLKTNNNQNLKVDNEPIEEVEQFVYLGSVITTTGGTTEDVDARIKKAKGAFAQLSKLWNARDISLRTKMRLFQSNVKSVLLYGSESWFMTKAIETKLQVFVNKCLRRLLKIYWPENIRNNVLWERTKQKPIELQIKERKFRWLGHTLRKDNTEISKQALRWNPQGQRRRGRPKNSWRRQMEKELTSLRLTLNTAETEAQDRVAWRGLVCGLCSYP